MEKVIPKKIHYFWFGDHPKPDSVKKCIASWEKQCPDYEIIEWNEKNYDINKISFCKEAYEAKKWSFVSDVARLDVIYNHGGLYFDTDVEIIKSFDDLLEISAFVGFESDEYVNPGSGFGAVPKSKVIKEFLDIYSNIDFRKHIDDLSKISIPILITEILCKKGLEKNGELQHIGNLTVLPAEYFSPKNLYTRVINITGNTHSIHHYDASWVDAKEKAFINGLDNKGKAVMSKYPDLVSIIIPVYNGEEYVRKAIDSALSQTYKNIEVLVINDGSTDNSDSIIKEYGARIRYFNKSNGGVASALNLGISKMRGKYFSWLSHDDMYYPEKIEMLFNHIKKCKKNTIAISDWTIIDEKDHVIKQNVLDDKLEIVPRAFLAFDRKTWLNACAMLILKELFDKFGYFDESLRTTQDYDMFNTLMKSGVKFSILHQPLLYSRSHEKQGSLSDPGALDNSDLIHTKIIQDLSIAEIIKYFNNDYKKIVSVYDSFFKNGYRRTPAHFLKRIVEVMIKNPDDNRAINIISEKLSGKTIVLQKADKSAYLKKMRSNSGKKRLLFCTTHWLTGGMERVLSNLFTQLNPKYELFLITPYDGRESCIKIPDYVTKIRISDDLYYDYFDSMILSYALLFDIDVVIGFTNLHKKQLDFYELCKGTNIKTVASTHEYYFYPYRSPYHYDIASKRLELLKSADVVLWLTNFSAAAYSLYNNNGYLLENPNTFEIQKKQNNKKDKIILCVGRFNDYVKRVDRILGCYKLIQGKEPDTKLLLVGKCDRDATFRPGDNSTINDIIKKTGINVSNVIFAGEVDDIKKYYSQASLVLLTSNSEGFPMVINEAACFGVPIVCNKIPGLEDLVIDGENGYLTEQDDLQTMADRVCDILSNDELKKRLSSNAKKLAKRFDTKNISDKWEFLIDNLLSEKSDSTLRNNLDKRLSYSIIDNKSFNKIVAKELNNAFNECVSSRQNMEVDYGLIASFIRRFRKLVRSIRNYGFLNTGLKVLKKIKSKSVRLFCNKPRI